MKHKCLFFLALIFTSAISYAQYEIWETQLDVDNYTHLDRIFFLDENYGWAIGGNTIGSAGPYFFTSDGGKNWYLDPNFWDNWGTDIAFVNQYTGFIAGGNGTLLKTIDSGQSWMPIQTPATQNLIKLFFVDENNGWATLGQYSEGNILHTIDGGDNWQLEKIFTSDYSIIEEVYFANYFTGYCTGVIWDYLNNNTYNSVMNTQNGGVYWDTSFLWQNTLYEINAIFFNDPLNGWLVGSKPTSTSIYIVMNTSDGGANWTEQTLEGNFNQPPTQANCVYFADDTTGWIGTSGADGGAIYFTNNGGQSWQVQQEFPQAVYDIQMLNRDTGWAVGGDFVYHTTNGSFVTNVIENYVEKEPFIIMPNPVTNAFCIETNSGFFCENCHLEITNITGNSILQLNNISFEAITHNPIDLSNFPAGIYFVAIRYKANHQIRSFNQKIIKQ